MDNLNLLREYIKEEIRYIVYEEKYLKNLNETVQTITKQEAINKIIATEKKGLVFTVTFKKKNGSKRVLNGRLGVKKYLKGGSLRYDARAYGYIPVFDMQKKVYRMVNVKTIESLKIGNEVNIVK